MKPSNVVCKLGISCPRDPDFKNFKKKTFQKWHKIMGRVPLAEISGTHSENMSYCPHKKSGALRPGISRNGPFFKRITWKKGFFIILFHDFILIFRVFGQKMPFFHMMASQLRQIGSPWLQEIYFFQMKCFDTKWEKKGVRTLSGRNFWHLTRKKFPEIARNCEDLFLKSRSLRYMHGCANIILSSKKES